jgi:hypothetical protein
MIKQRPRRRRKRPPLAEGNANDSRRRSLGQLDSRQDILIDPILKQPRQHGDTDALFQQRTDGEQFLAGRGGLG